VKNFAAGEDVPSRCPALTYEPMNLAARGELDQRAAQLVQAAPPVAAVPASTASAPAAPASAASAPVPVKPPAKPKIIRKTP
jgi:hypothetical protein